MANKIKIVEVNPNLEEAKELINELDEYQSSLYPPESNHLDSVDELAAQNVIFVVASLEGKIKGCGAIKKGNGDYGEIKRVYVSPSARGNGMAKSIVRYLEEKIRAQGINIVRLETGIYQQEAIGLYEKLGYKRIRPFGKYTEDPLSIFMEKKLIKNMPEL